MKATKISIIEFDYHPEVLRNTLRILDGMDLQIQVFTSVEIWNNTNVNSHQFKNAIELYLNQAKKKSLPSFLKDNLQALNSSDIILFNTMASAFKTFKDLKLKPIQILRIHNANAYFGQFRNNYRPIFSPFFVWKDFSHFLRNSLLKLDWYYRRKFMDQMHYFAFPNNSIRQYSHQKFHLQKSQSLSLPFSYLNSDSPGKNNSQENEITISVVGKVDQRNRDYNILVKALEYISSQKRQYQIKLVLLGSSKTKYGSKILQDLNRISDPQIHIKSFPGFVEQEDFNRYIQETDFLILPIRINTRYTIYKEYYGSTKISGGINDIMVYKKPALIVSDYPLDEDFKKVCVPFTNEIDLAHKIMDWCDKQNYKDINIDEALNAYSLKQIQKLYQQTFQEILNNR